jgi:energy-coupling factor transport system substrate-specific component
MLMRVRSRLQVSWEPAPPAAAPARLTAGSLSGPLAGIVAVLTLGGMALLAGPPARAGAAGSPAAAARATLTREVDYLRRAQNGDGGFGPAAGSSSSELYSAWAAIGLAAAGQSPRAVVRDGHTVLDAIIAEASSLQGAGDLERTILALRAAGASPRSLPGGDPVVRLLRFRAGDGSFGDLVNQTAFAVLALRAAGYPRSNGVLRAACAWLVRQQEPGGGFGFATRGAGSDVDDTAAVLQALAAAGRESSASAGRAVHYVLSAQNPDGGFPQEGGGASNAQSTSWAVQGLVAAGRNPEAVRREGSRSPVGYLESLEAPDGSVRYSRTGAQTPVWVTAQAMTALAERPLPIAPVGVAHGAASPTRGPAHTVARRDPGRDAAGERGLAASTRALHALLARLLGFLEH